MTQLNIWVVEDDDLYRSMLTSFLKILGYPAQAFASGEDCLQHLNEKPDIVLLDQHLGDGMKGIDVLRKIKEEHLKTHVIFISAQEKISVVSETYQFGSEEYISKDTASLIRLKLRLEKIKNLKDLYRKKVKTRKYTLLGYSFAALVLILIIIYIYGI